jgi:hypothetical protein
MRLEGVNGLTVGGLLNLVAERRPGDALVCPDRNLRYTYRELRDVEKGCAQALMAVGRARPTAGKGYGMQTSVGDTAQITSRESPTSAGAACPVRASGCYHCVVLGDWGPACARDRTEGGLEWCLKASERGG